MRFQVGRQCRVKDAPAPAAFPPCPVDWTTARSSSPGRAVRLLAFPGRRIAEWPVVGAPQQGGHGLGRRRRHDRGLRAQREIERRSMKSLSTPLTRSTRASFVPYGRDQQPAPRGWAYPALDGRRSARDGEGCSAPRGDDRARHIAGALALNFMHFSHNAAVSRTPAWASSPHLPDRCTGSSQRED
jgi:hypothetical protein